MTEYRDTLYEAYKAERSKLDSCALEAGARYDKTVLVLGGGGLALSLTFLEKIAPTPIPWTLSLLLAAWVFLLLSIVFQLLALAASQAAIRLQIERLDTQYQGYFTAEDPGAAVLNCPAEGNNPFADRTRCLNTTSCCFLIIGIALLFAFSAAHFTLRAQQGDTNGRSQGQVASTPDAAQDFQKR